MQNPVRQVDRGRRYTVCICTSTPPHMVARKRVVLDGISSRHTRRAYSQALDEFLIWFHDEPGREFNKAAVQKHRAELETKGLAPSSINVRRSAIRRLAPGADDNGVMAPELATGIARVSLRGSQVVPPFSHKELQLEPRV